MLQNIQLDFESEDAIVEIKYYPNHHSFEDA